jgi:hypothetical protein
MHQSFNWNAGTCMIETRELWGPSFNSLASLWPVCLPKGSLRSDGIHAATAGCARPVPSFPLPPARYSSMLSQTNDQSQFGLELLRAVLRCGELAPVESGHVLLP